MEKNVKTITRLAIFDFDGTTMDTLYPEIGKPIYLNKTGKEWPHKGWWGRIESLDMDIFDFNPIPEVKLAFDVESKDENALMVSLTGRRKNLSVGVEAILHANGYKFHKYLYNYGGDTLTNKLEQINNLLEEYPNVRSIIMFDDRLEHMPVFKDYLEKLTICERLDYSEFVPVHNEQWTK